MEYPKRNVLIAIDGSKNADYAFEYYCTRVQYPHDNILFFHFMDSVSTSNDLQESLHELYSYRGNYMEGLKTIFKAKSRTHHISEDRIRFDFTCDPPEPGKAICAQVKKYKIDMIIMGCRGLSKLKKAFIGSVSDHVIRNAGIPILTIPLAKH